MLINNALCVHFKHATKQLMAIFGYNYTSNNLKY